jgi:hypothetical protein
VAGNGYVFGAYTHCSWPKEPGFPRDPSNQSFLFSLVHKAGQAPIRFSQCDFTRPAVGLSSNGLYFGNFSLMIGGRSASASDGNVSVSVGSVTTNALAYQPDDVSQCDASFVFAEVESGSFACEEIEVYETDGSDRKETGAAAANGSSDRSRSHATTAARARARRAPTQAHTRDRRWTNEARLRTAALIVTSQQLQPQR